MVEILKIINIGLKNSHPMELEVQFEDRSWKNFQDYLDETIEKKLESLGLLQEKIRTSEVRPEKIKI